MSSSYPVGGGQARWGDIPPIYQLFLNVEQQDEQRRVRQKELEPIVIPLEEFAKTWADFQSLKAQDLPINLDDFNEFYEKFVKFKENIDAMFEPNQCPEEIVYRIGLICSDLDSVRNYVFVDKPIAFALEIFETFSETLKNGELISEERYEECSRFIGRLTETLDKIGEQDRLKRITELWEDVQMHRNTGVSFDEIVIIDHPEPPAKGWNWCTIS